MRRRGNFVYNRVFITSDNYGFWDYMADNLGFRVTWTIGFMMLFPPATFVVLVITSPSNATDDVLQYRMGVDFCVILAFYIFILAYPTIYKIMRNRKRKKDSYQGYCDR